MTALPSQSQDSVDMLTFQWEQHLLQKAKTDAPNKYMVRFSVRRLLETTHCKHLSSSDGAHMSEQMLVQRWKAASFLRGPVV